MIAEKIYILTDEKLYEKKRLGRIVQINIIKLVIGQRVS